MFFKNQEISSKISKQLIEIMGVMNIRQNELSSNTNIPANTLNGYITGRSTPDAKALMKFYEFGININYLFDPNQSMFNTTTKGIELSTKYEKHNITPQNYKIYTWLILFYDSIDNFINITSFDKIEILELIHTLYWTNRQFEIAEKLIQYGLNYRWLLGTDDNIMANTDAGIKLVKQKFGIEKLDKQLLLLKRIKPTIEMLMEDIAIYTAE